MLEITFQCRVLCKAPKGRNLPQQLRDLKKQLRHELHNTPGIVQVFTLELYDVDIPQELMELKLA